MAAFSDCQNYRTFKLPLTIMMGVLAVTGITEHHLATC